MDSPIRRSVPGDLKRSSLEIPVLDEPPAILSIHYIVFNIWHKVINDIFALICIGRILFMLTYFNIFFWMCPTFYNHNLTNANLIKILLLLYPLDECSYDILEEIIKRWLVVPIKLNIKYGRITIILIRQIWTIFRSWTKI